MTRPKEFTEERALEIAKALREILPDQILFHLVAGVVDEVYDEDFEEAFKVVHHRLEHDIITQLKPGGQEPL